MNATLRVLIAEDNHDDTILLVNELNKSGYEIDYLQVDSEDAMRKALRERDWDIVISEHNMQLFNAHEAIKLLSEIKPDIPIIIASNETNINLIISFMKNGASDYIQKSQLSLLPSAIENSIKKANTLKENSQTLEYLKQSEKRYKILAENATDIISTHDAAGVCLYISPSIIATTGYTPEEIVGRTTVFLYHPDDVERVKTYHYKNVELIKQPPIEYRMVKKDGSEIWVETSSKTIHDPDKNDEIKIISVSRDITSRKKTEHELRESESKLKAMFDLTGIGMGVLDSKKRWLKLNNSLQQMLGYEESEMIGIPVTDITYPDDIKQTDINLDNLFYNKTNFYKTEKRYIKKDGSIIWIYASVTPIRDENGNLIEFVGALMDITERKLAEHTLEKTEAQLKAIFDVAGVGIVVLDNKGKWTKLNRTFLDMLGYSEEELINHPVLEVTYSEDKPITNRNIHGLISGKINSYRYEKRYTKKNGEIIWVDASVTAIRDENNKLVSFVGAVADITNRKLAIQALEETEARFRGLFEAVPSGVAIYEVINDGLNGSDYIIKDFNKKGLTIESKTKEEVVSKSLYDLKPNIDEYGLIPIFREVWRTGIPAFYPTKIYVDNTYYNYYENRIFKLPSGEIVSIYDNVTDRKKTEEELKESESKLKAMFDFTGIGIGLIKRNMRWVKFNKPLLNMLGYDEDELLDKAIADMTHPDDIPITNKTRDDLIFNKTDTARIEKRYLKKDGSPLWVDISVNALRDENKYLTEFVIAVMDINEKKLAMQAQQESEARLKAIFDLSGVGIGLAGSNARWITVNKAMLQMLGYEEDELIGKSAIEMTHSDDVEQTNINTANLISNKKNSYRMEKRYLKKDGNPLWVDLSVTALRDKNKNLTAYVAAIMDINDKKLALQALKESEAKLHSLFNNMLEGVALHQMVYDEDGKAINYIIVDTNKQYGEILDIDIESIRGKLSTEVYNVSEAPYLDIYGEVVQTGESRTLDTYYSPMDRYFEISVVRWGDDGFATIFSDITSRKQYEDTLKELNQKLEIRVAERTAQLEATNKELEAFSYSVSHDLRAPIRSINGFSNALLEDYYNVLDEEGRGYLRRVSDSALKMNDLIDDILKLSRISTGEINLSNVNLSAIITRILNNFKSNEPERDAEFIIKHSVHAVCDMKLIEIALQNLLSNAWKFTSKREKTRIEFGVINKDDETIYYIKDNGAGFDMKYVDKLFVVFQRLHDIQDFEGTGVGLAIVMRIINKHGGKIWAESEVEKGTTFYFTLPEKDVIAI